MTDSYETRFKFAILNQYGVCVVDAVYDSQEECENLLEKFEIEFTIGPDATGRTFYVTNVATVVIIGPEQSV